jgi:hypothetical protein
MLSQRFLLLYGPFLKNKIACIPEGKQKFKKLIEELNVHLNVIANNLKWRKEIIFGDTKFHFGFLILEFVT